MRIHAGVIGSWTPAALAGLSLWLRPSLASGADGDPVSSEPDASGAGWNATGSGSTRPLLRVTGIGSVPALEYAGSQSLFASGFTGVNGASALTAYSVLKPDPLSGGMACASPDLAFAHQLSGGRLLHYFGAGTSGRFDLPGDYAHPMIFASVFDGSQTGDAARLKLYWNGAAQTASYGASVPASLSEGSSGLYVGRYSGGANWVGKLGDQLVYVGQAHDASTVLRVVSYLSLAFQIGSVVCDGNSLTVGYGQPAGTDWPTQCATLLSGLTPSRDYTWQNFAVNGQETPQMSADAATQIDPWSAPGLYRNACVVWEGTNDMRSNGISAAAAWTNLAAYCSARLAAGWAVYLLTVLPRDCDLTGVPATYDRHTLNALIRSNAPGLGVMVVDVAADPDIGQDGAQLNTTYYQSDTTHLTAAGAAVVAQYVRDAILGV